ncbi:MAG: PH domain-containing protein [Candidatus Omnitrophica bacterium]|nr:PH domain-containing protein [Candidatus Omnitrophota bacterium]MBU1048301.1 PH domain-containing protein [Candidatus Omnitrophota bacterium]MBU1889717.1 PH domain-containing protein [Candidatus Omnitrophota bacterium]
MKEQRGRYKMEERKDMMRETKVIFSDRPNRMDIGAGIYWMVGWAFLIWVSGLTSHIILRIVLWLIVPIVFVIWLPREYSVLEDRIRIKCNCFTKDIPYKNIDSIMETSFFYSIINCAFRAVTLQTSFTNTIVVKLKRGMFLIQISPLRMDEFINEAQKALANWQ